MTTLVRPQGPSAGSVTPLLGTRSKREVKTVTIEKLVGAVSRPGRTACGVNQGSNSTSHKGKPLYRIDFIPNVTPKSVDICRNPTERHNEKTRQMAGFTGVPEILVAFTGT